MQIKQIKMRTLMAGPSGNHQIGKVLTVGEDIGKKEAADLVKGRYAEDYVSPEQRRAEAEAAQRAKEQKAKQEAEDQAAADQSETAQGALLSETATENDGKTPGANKPAAPAGSDDAETPAK